MQKTGLQFQFNFLLAFQFRCRFRRSSEGSSQKSYDWGAIRWPQHVWTERVWHTHTHTHHGTVFMHLHAAVKHVYSSRAKNNPNKGTVSSCETCGHFRKYWNTDQHIVVVFYLLLINGFCCQEEKKSTVYVVNISSNYKRGDKIRTNNRIY